MSFEFRLPDIGEGLHEGTLIEWLVNVGDKVSLDQPFARVETDKAVVELPAPKAATVKALHASAGDIIHVGQVMITFEQNGASNSVATTATPETTQQPTRILATPRVRALARRLGVELSSVTASGERGKITEEDVKRAASSTIASGSLTTPSEESVSTVVGWATPAPTRSTSSNTNQAIRKTMSLPQTHLATSVQEPIERIPVSHLRGVIAQAMQQSKQTSAHVTHVDEVDVTALLSAYHTAKEQLKRWNPSPIKLSPLPYFIKAIVAALKRHPYLNASYDEASRQILLKKSYHIGFAVDTDEGLVVPVVKHADQKNVLEIAIEVSDLAERARHRRLKVDELKNSTFTISSIGPLGGMFATPIINQPNLAICGFHAIKERPAVVGGQVVPRSLMFVSISYDHRFIDGMVAARFMQDLLTLLENPALLTLTS